jgi:anthranilate phosphoribosyltransferase
MTAPELSQMRSILQLLTSGRTLSAEQTRTAFNLIMDGAATPAQIGAFLIALRIKGETAQDLIAAASALRDRCVAVHAPMDAMDIVGTGGDRSGSYNVSTAAALIVAGLGVPVAKHGNRSITSKSGTADTLEALGVKINQDAAGIARSLNQAGMAFMLAPSFHLAMRQVGPIRSELGVPTIFNLTGPLCNPAKVRRMVVGIYDPAKLEAYAQALIGLGVDRAWVVHGTDGLDELSTAAPSHVLAIDHGTITRFSITAADGGLGTADGAALVGGDAQHNARALMQLLEGAPGAYRDIAILNAAAALMVAGRADNLIAAAEMAARSIDEGLARNALARLVASSNEPGP